MSSRMLVGQHVEHNARRFPDKVALRVAHGLATGPQLAIRLSDGCIQLRLAQFRKPPGVPSQVPMRKTGAAGVTQAEPMFCPVVSVPAVTVTVRVATASSPWYSVWV